MLIIARPLLGNGWREILLKALPAPSKDEVIRMAADFYTKWETMANKVYDACDEPEEARRIMVDFWPSLLGVLTSLALTA
jgi:hypothetical protein